MIIIKVIEVIVVVQEAEDVIANQEEEVFKKKLYVDFLISQ